MSRKLNAMVVGCVGAVLLCAEASAVLDTQRLSKHSALVAVDGSRIEDYEFAGWAEDAMLGAAGKADVRDAAFLFQQGFGGGMLDDLATALNAHGIAWVG